MKTDFFPHDYEKIRGRLLCRLLHMDRVMLCPQTVYVNAFANLCAVPCIFETGSGGEQKSSPITLPQAAAWGIGSAQLVRDALKNMRKVLPATLDAMGDLMESSRSGSVRSSLLPVLKGRFPDTPEDKLDQVACILARRIGQRAQEAGKLKPMWVLGNAAGYYGAVSVLYPKVLEDFSEKTGGSFYVLPSSVNDVILLPEGGMETKEKLYEMVASANRKMTDGEMWLSDSVYYYDRGNMEIRLF